MLIKPRQGEGGRERLPKEQIHEKNQIATRRSQDAGDEPSRRIE
jgi:hypothetical protein